MLPHGKVTFLLPEYCWLPDLLSIIKHTHPPTLPLMSTLAYSLSLPVFQGQFAEIQGKEQATKGPLVPIWMMATLERGPWQHMGTGHGWKHTNATTPGAGASSWHTESMGNLESRRTGKPMNLRVLNSGSREREQRNPDHFTPDIFAPWAFGLSTSLFWTEILSNLESSWPKSQRKDLCFPKLGMATPS